MHVFYADRKFLKIELSQPSLGIFTCGFLRRLQLDEVYNSKQDVRDRRNFVTDFVQKCEIQIRPPQKFWGSKSKILLRWSNADFDSLSNATIRVTIGRRVVEIKAILCFGSISWFLQK